MKKQRLKNSENNENYFRKKNFEFPWDREREPQLSPQVVAEVVVDVANWPLLRVACLPAIQPTLANWRWINEATTRGSATIPKSIRSRVVFVPISDFNLTTNKARVWSVGVTACPHSSLSSLPHCLCCLSKSPFICFSALCCVFVQISLRFQFYYQLWFWVLVVCRVCTLTMCIFHDIFIECAQLM